MINIGDYAVPLIFAFTVIYGLCRRQDVFSQFIEGVKEGLQTCRDIFPSLFVLVVSVGMFSASGAVEQITELLRPVTGFFGFPPECTPLLILRPFSGSGAVAMYENILTSCGADSFAGRVASVMLGSSETTFYTIAVYFAAVKAKDTRHALPSALAGDLTGFIVSAISVRLLFSAC